MAARRREQATYQDLIDAPDNLTAELVDGELFLSPRPRARHSDLLTEIAAHLRLRLVRGWVILSAPEVHLGRDVFVPDIAGWRRERLSLGDEVGIEVVPDWVCDRRVKLPKYAHYGVKHAWVVDLVSRTLEVKRLTNGAWVEVAVFNADEPFRAEPFEELEIVLDVQWPSPPS